MEAGHGGRGGGRMRAFLTEEEKKNKPVLTAALLNECSAICCHIGNNCCLYLWR